ncbi:hypothetical protein L227DRAFT_496593 [Lentinus tigrinus ALCF2SS1-6]|uniref:Mediator complex subunit 27 n=1 Tax=Lentinus tigrinus ALCF2SS1-6 TaxID=1328759 RepID=A0A5C2SJI1_9APHY|nr:hypothetical protein L227DRAFT_496593 [Lentinus tigrinus ALCF2SS1-6]
MPPPPLPAPHAAPPSAPASDTANTNATANATATPAPAAPATPASELATLRTHIQTLTEFNNRLQGIRRVPAQLLRPPGAHQLEPSLVATHGFKGLATIAESVRSEKVQDALKAARKSELADPSNLGSNLRRENLKRRRPPSPESPQPYRETESKETSFLPPVEPGTVAVTLNGLPAYIREHNKAGKNKLHVVAPKKGRKLECPVVLRFTVPNVVTVYLTLDDSTQDGQTLLVANATAIGSREQKPPHSQSDFMVFQQLSQQLAKVIRSDPMAPLQAYVGLLSKYERLFIEKCTNCHKVISVEGHVPPVVRRRVTATTGSDAPFWDVRHVMCQSEPKPPGTGSSENGAENEGDAGGGEGGGSNSV